MQDLHIEVRVQDIVVTMPGTTLRVVYRKPHRGSQLVARLDYFQDQQRGPITRAEFLTRALKAANDRRASWGGLCKVMQAQEGGSEPSPLPQCLQMNWWLKSTTACLRSLNPEAMIAG